MLNFIMNLFGYRPVYTYFFLMSVEFERSVEEKSVSGLLYLSSPVDCKDNYAESFALLEFTDKQDGNLVNSYLKSVNLLHKTWKRKNQ